MIRADDTTISTIRHRWKSGQHVGAQRPQMRAWVRSGRLQRKFRQVPPDQVYSQVPGITGRKIWQGLYVARTAFVELPNLKDVEIEQNFDENGVAQATVKLDNIGMIEHSGVAGIYHRIHRGYYAPFRGYKPPNRPSVETRNDWFDILHDSSTQIMIVSGYGDAAIPVFLGLVNDSDFTSRPDEITLTCRDWGQFLTDQHVFINAKIRTIPDPITFADRKDAENTERKAAGAWSSSHDPQHPARLAIRNHSNADFWQSGPNHTKNALEWIDIAVPAGRYDSIELHPRYAGMEAWIVIYARDKGAPGGHGAMRRFDERLPEGYISEGRGHVPGTGVPFIRHIPKLKAKRQEIGFPEWGYMLGDNSRIRVYFSNLDHGLHGRRNRQRDYRAGVIKFAGIRRRTKKEAKREKWILVDDVSEIVKTVFQWAGINEWEVESSGVRLHTNTRTVFNRGDFLIDIVNRVADSLGYVFYMKPPDVFDEEHLGTDHNLSTGIGVFRMNQSMRERPLDPTELIHEDQVLKGVDAKFSDEPLAYNIRVRGAHLDKKDGGRTLGGDTAHHYMYVYNPPWSRDVARVTALGGQNVATGDNFRNGNLKKYVVWHDDFLKSLDECKVAALFIAFREALESAQVTIDAPAMPSIYVDHHAAIFDTGTGLSTRLWVATRTLHWTGGEQGTFVMTLGGSLIDTPDIVAVRGELNHALRDSNFDPGLSRWDIEHNYTHAYRNVS